MPVNFKLTRTYLLACSEVGGPIGAMTPGMLIISASDSSGTVSAMDLTSEAVENYDIERCAREGYLVLRDSENEDSGQGTNVNTIID